MAVVAVAVVVAGVVVQTEVLAAQSGSRCRSAEAVAMESEVEMASKTAVAAVEARVQ